MKDGLQPGARGSTHGVGNVGTLGGMQCQAVGGGPCASLDFSSLLMRTPRPLIRENEERGQWELAMGVLPVPSWPLEVVGGRQGG